MAGTRRSPRTNTPFRDALPALLEDRGISHRQLAAGMGLPQSYLSLVLNGKRSPSRKLLERSASALELPSDYFPEYREQAAVDAIKQDSQLRDRIYDSLKRAG